MVTLASNYKTFLQPETVEVVDRLIEENFYIDDMLKFIDEYSEPEFVKYYEFYVEQGEAVGYDVVDAYIYEYGFEDIESVSDLFVNLYSSVSDFAEEYTNELNKIPDNVIVDWDATWERILSWDFDAVDCYQALRKGYGVYIFRKYI